MSRSRLTTALAIAMAAGYPLVLYRDPPTPKIATTDDDMERIAKAERKRARKAAKRLREALSAAQTSTAPGCADCPSAPGERR